jgi:ribosomal protein S27AE
MLLKIYFLDLNKKGDIMENTLLLPKKILKPKYTMVHLGKRFIRNIGRRKKVNGIKVAGKQAVEYINEYCYCFKCKKAVHANITTNHVFTNDSYGFNQEQEVYTCPECGTSSIDIMQLNSEYIQFRNYFLDGNKLKIKLKFVKFNWYNNSLIMKNILKVIVMNLDTGYTYVLPEMVNGKITKKKTIINSTYGGCGMDYNSYTPYSYKCKDYYKFYNEVYEIVRKFKMEKLNIYIPTYEEAYLSKDIFNKQYANKIKKKIPKPNYLSPGAEDVVMLNRFPTLSPFVSRHNFYNYGKDGFRTKIRRIIKNDSKDPFKDLLLHYDIPATKTSKNKMKINILYPYYYKNLLKYVKNHDNINKILNDDYLNRIGSHDFDILTNALEIMTKYKNFKINSFCNRIENASYFTFIDSLRLINRIYKRKNDYEFNFKSQFSEMHDFLSTEYSKLKNENQIIEYNEEDHEIEGKFGELTFKLAKDTHELIDVGTYMHICVGGYGDDAVDKILNIAIAINDEGIPIICIEMCKDYYKLKQTKLYRNNRNCANWQIEEGTIEYEALKLWAEANNLCFDTCDIPEKLKVEHNSRQEVINKGKKIERFTRTKIKKAV